MLAAVQGVFRKGRIELLEPLAAAEESRVIVTLLPTNSSIDLGIRGIDASHAAEMRSRFGAASEDWDRPEMDAYDSL